MRTSGILISGWGAIVLLGSAGCEPPGPSPLQFSVRQVNGMQASVAFRQAEAVLMREGYRIDRRDPAGGILTTKPVRLTGGRKIRGRGIALTRPAATREIAEVRIAGVAEGLRVHCRVIVQELATEAYRLSFRERGTSDSPGATPIEREAATTSEQNAVWRTIFRDKVMERRILSAIMESTERPGAGNVDVP